MANHLKPHKRQAVVDCYINGFGIRATERATGVHRDTITRLLRKIETVSNQMSTFEETLEIITHCYDKLEIELSLLCGNEKEKGADND